MPHHQAVRELFMNPTFVNSEHHFLDKAQREGLFARSCHPEIRRAEHLAHYFIRLTIVGRGFPKTTNELVCLTSTLLYLAMTGNSWESCIVRKVEDGLEHNSAGGDR